ncbi:DUF2267 domain-containing protein [Brucella anthropi]|jgi:uncharacterized protein (DUF2267 family)|uniref:DUF2267 domain-containing protein n=1 Tax=Brucella anthropi TaxID=529 RepID=A0A6I0DV64_BRUAN|nr:MULTISPECIES: DUF2267 domain-containing protein [Brucella/Ochrobactrum group]QTN01795.1 DUF2267 domain-containing protein [Ochrobactrum sp. EEELCW01]KAB2741084.1 DUF2267 domain-containing protein [Brucella anthropi]KAB2758989.1 DUF2267 domain-containing protein [Brucella anthropi]KAB2770129.1 DUF2267 domain-containing protein [Brucella anthropi]KAB2789253.1 DUF2267 domain-containing protein [Brucella anthropi]
MTIPLEIQRATEEFDKFLHMARDEAGLATRNQAYTMVEAVLLTFRHRLEVDEAIRFATILPPVLRAVFVANWDIGEIKRPFQNRQVLTREVQSLRKDHNFAPDSAIYDVAKALRAHIDQVELDSFLAGLSAEARQYWAI